jgi:hypothetical protein
VRGEFGGGEALTSHGTDYLKGVDGVLGEILAGSSETNAVPPYGDTFPSWRVSWLPLVCFLCFARETLKLVLSSMQ